MAVPFNRIQPTFQTLEEARIEFVRLQDEIVRALAKAESAQAAAATPVPTLAPLGAQTLTFTNAPDTLPDTSPSVYLRFVADDGSEVVVPGFRVR